MWNIVFFEKDNGRCPISDFLEALSPRNDLPYIKHRLEQLSEHGYKLDRPLAAHLGDGIYELRVKTINGQFRFFYFFFDGENIIVTHGMRKKSQKVPEAELKLAKEYRSIYYVRHGKRK